MSRPSLRTAAPPPSLPLYIKDLLKRNAGRLMAFWIGGLLVRMTLLLLLLAVCVCKSEDRNFKREHGTVQV
jgi:hypothetical protein